VPGFSQKTEHVPGRRRKLSLRPRHHDGDPSRALPTTAASMIQGYHGTGKSTHIGAGRGAPSTGPASASISISHISRIDLIGKDAIVLARRQAG